MTAPVVESITGTSFGVDATSHLANYPASVTAGWLLLILASFDGSTTVNNPSGSGYSIVGSGNQGDASISTAVFAKIAAGTEGGGTVDVTTSNVQSGGVQIVAISGWKGALADLVVGQRNGFLGYGNKWMPTGATWRKIDHRLISVISKTSAAAFVGTPTNWTGSTQAGQDSAAGAAVRCDHIAISDLIFADLKNIGSGFGSSNAIHPEFAILVPQAFLGTVSGDVTLAGSPVSGASVTVRNQTTGDVFTGTTNGSGQYSIPVPNTTDLYHVEVTYTNAGTKYNALSLWDVDAV